MSNPPRSLKNVADTTADQVGRGWRSAADRVPGGTLTLWVILGLLLLALGVWALWPSANSARSGRFGVGGPQAVGVANATGR